VQVRRLPRHSGPGVGSAPPPRAEPRRPSVDAAGSPDPHKAPTGLTQRQSTGLGTTYLLVWATQTPRV
jgi:hypothetical protein